MQFLFHVAATLRNAYSFQVIFILVLTKISHLDFDAMHDLVKKTSLHNTYFLSLHNKNKNVTVRKKLS